MEGFPKPKATLVIKVMEHGTITGAEGAGHLEFDDCVNAVNGLIDWMARSLGEVDETDRGRIGTEILTAALYSWTFDQHMEAAEEDEDLLDEDEPGEDELEEGFPSN